MIDQKLVDYLESQGHSHERALQIAGNHPDAVREEMELKRTYVPVSSAPQVATREDLIQVTAEITKAAQSVVAAQLAAEAAAARADAAAAQCVQLAAEMERQRDEEKKKTSAPQQEGAIPPAAPVAVDANG